MSQQREDIYTHSDSSKTVYAAYPDWLKERLEWFQDLKFGLILHWGIYTLWDGCIESWPLVEEDTWARPDDLKPWIERGKNLEQFRRDYWALNMHFNPTEFDPNLWAEAAEEAGMKYVAFTTKHHDGFCMFDTKWTDYRVTHPSCPFHKNPRANIAKHVFQAFRERGFGITCYFSKSDWHSPYYWHPDAPARDRNPNYDTRKYPERWEKFVQYVHGQITELMTDYGRIDVLWLDGGQVRPPDQDIRMAEIAAKARQLQPGLIIADRTVGGEYENIITPEHTIPEIPPNHPWESCFVMGTSWPYKRNDQYKSTRTLIHMIIEIVGKGGNALLGFGPTPRGTFAPEIVARLREIGKWMRVNAEAIYGTRSLFEFREKNTYYTKKGRNVYAIILSGDESDSPPTEIRLVNVRPAPGTEVHLLGREEPLEWQLKNGQTSIAFPRGKPPCEHAWVIKVVV
ncbi:MAG: alpha-L-fucosidase [candidate division KSB1 bacterium]|nr:alpha-L-fucosidase [candidate division KSB1 bacterium]MDZ7304730.1 alpha-L-fucosidase [candidate division KSB1 bacterium]MDZ7313834.1 alpha-L-fucosidase [candidate division KSB1 bacterium]